MFNSEVFRIKSDNRGPTVIIMGGVHGNEHCGVNAINNSVNIKIKKGEVIFVIANKKALEANKRFVESNLNREFRNNLDDTLEQKTARELQPLLDKADALLDLHASNTKESIPFVICEEKSVGLAKVLPGKFVIIGLNEFQKGSTDDYMDINNKVAVCMENGYTEDEQSTKRAEQSINAFLKYYDMVDEEVIKEQQIILHAKGIYTCKTKFIPTKEFADFEEVKKGEVVGKDEEEVLMPEDGRVVFVREREQKGDECFIWLVN